MAFVPGFEYDIFISYAHVDNQMATSEAAGWVETFHKNLRIRLSQRFGRDGLVAIWRDENLTGDQLFDQVIQSRANSRNWIALGPPIRTRWSGFWKMWIEMT